MIYTRMTKAALKLCFDAHKDQVDKSGQPYVFHPFHLAEQMDTEEAVCVALLHDVIEDTDFTIDDMRDAGMNEAVLDALLLLTHDPTVEYMDYVRALSHNPLARKVKLADLKHNMDASRLDSVTEADLERKAKYKEAFVLLAKADAQHEMKARGRAVEDNCYSIIDVKRWIDSLLERGVSPTTKLVIERERGIEGYTYVDDLYCDDSRYPDNPTVPLGSNKLRAKAWKLMLKE